MSIGGKTREVKDFGTKIIGLAEVKVLTINPTEQEFKEILNMELKEDSKVTEYLGESKEGNTSLRVDVWVETIKTGKKDKITFFLENKNRVNKEGTKDQYINNIGACSWADDENNLPSWFSARDFRKANNGEEELYIFLRTWLAKLDYKDAETVLEIEWKKIMKGNLSDLKNQIDGAYASNFICLFTIRSVQKDDEVKEYQSIYNKAFLPPFAMKQFRLVDYDKDEVVSALQVKYATKPKDLKPYERFVLTVRGEYGCKDSYTLREAKEYTPDDFLVASNETLVTDSSDY